MPFNVTAVAATEDEIFPPGTVPGGWRFSIDSVALANGIQVVTSTGPSYQWTNLGPGTYTFRAVRLAADGVTELGDGRTTIKTLLDVTPDLKRAIILGSTRRGHVRYALWAMVPPNVQADYFTPGLISAWSGAVTPENQALANGEIFEIVSIIRGGLTQAQLEAALELRWTRFNQAIQNLAVFNPRNIYWDGIDWIQA